MSTKEEWQTVLGIAFTMASLLNKGNTRVLRSTLVMLTTYAAEQAGYDFPLNEDIIPECARISLINTEKYTSRDYDGIQLFE